MFDKKWNILMVVGLIEKGVFVEEVEIVYKDCIDDIIIDFEIGKDVILEDELWLEGFD